MRTIPQKEDLTTEFKSDIKDFSDIGLVEEIVGMANTKGGILYLGVEDDGVITGVGKKHKDPIGVMALIANSTVPSISVRADLIEEEGMDVLCIEIPVSRLVVSTSSGKMLRRRLKADGSPENIPMYSYEVVTRLSELSQLDFSATPLSGAELSDFDPNQRIKLRSAIQTNPGSDKILLTLTDEELDKALHLTTEIEGKTYPTVTGILLLGKTEKIHELMPTVKSSFQVLEGTNVRANVEIDGPLLEVVEKFETYFNAWNPEREIEYGLFRLSVPEFNKSAFREGLINAISHRDYTMLGSIRVLIDDEGMTISSPGGFIDGVSMDNLLTVEPHGKNQALAETLKRIGLAEKTGRGIDKIFEGSIIYGRPWPDYSETTSNNVKLFIQRAKADNMFTKFIADEQNRIGKPLSIYSLMILSLLKDEKLITLSEMVKLTHLYEARLKSSLTTLIENGLIEEIANTKSSTYRLSKDVYQNMPNTAQGVIKQSEYSEKILKLAKKQGGIITKQDVSDLLNITPPQAYSEITKLVSENKLEKVNGGKYTKYRICK